MKHLQQSSLPRRGFTLIELSIVLVIIGLIVGGILVGQDLIHVAMLRATIGQMEKYNAAVNAFRMKFNSLPGDLASPTQFGLGGEDYSSFGVPPPNCWPGNNDGWIFGMGCTGSGGPSATGEEGRNFWVQLLQAGLIGENFSGYSGSDLQWEPTLGVGSPATKLGKGGWWVAGGPLANANNQSGLQLKGNNFFIARTLHQAAADQEALTPAEAYWLDTKVDDGLPMTGTAKAFQGNLNNPWGINWAIGGISGDICVNTATSPQSYYITNSNNRCNLVMQSSF